MYTYQKNELKSDLEMLIHLAKRSSSGCKGSFLSEAPGPHSIVTFLLLKSELKPYFSHFSKYLSDVQTTPTVISSVSFLKGGIQARP